MGNNEKTGIESESVIYNGFTLVNGTINGEDIIDSKLYVPKSIAIKYMEQKLSAIQR